MCRKIFYLGGAGVLFCMLVTGGYWATASRWVQEKIPVSVQIERADSMVKDLRRDIRNNMHIIAKEEVEVARLDEQLKKKETILVDLKQNIFRLKEDLTSPREFYTYGNRRYTPDQVREDLTRRFTRYKTTEANLTKLREIHTARTRGLDSAREKLDAMVQAKRQLEVEVANLVAQHKMVEVAQTTSRYSFDDSRLGRVKELVVDLQKRLDIELKVASAEGEYTNEIPLDAPNRENIVEEVGNYFESDPSDTEQHVAAIDLTD